MQYIKANFGLKLEDEQSFWYNKTQCRKHLAVYVSLSVLTGDVKTQLQWSWKCCDSFVEYLLLLITVHKLYKLNKKRESYCQKQSGIVVSGPRCVKFQSHSQQTMTHFVS